MKNSGVEWIGEIPDEWEVTQIKNLFFIGRGRVIAQTELDDNGIYPVYSSQTKDNGCLGYINTYDFDVNQLTWTTDGANAGTVFIRTGKHNCTNVCGTLQLKNDNNNLLYQKFALEYLTEFYKRSDTNGYKIMNNEMAKIITILPPKTTQKGIASYLDSKCSKIEETIQNQQQVIEKLKAYKQSLITEAVTGKIKIQNGKACGKYEEYKDSGVEWIGDIPSGWEPIKAKYFIKISNGSDPKTSEGNTPVYGSGAESFKTCVEYKEGPTVLIGRKGATLHIPHYIEGNYWNVDTAFDVKTYSEKKFLLRFYYYCATAFDYKFYLTSTTLPSMTQTNYGNMYLPVPNIQTQKEVVEFLDKQCKNIDTAIEQKEKLIEKLTEYKKSLIYECVTGKKEI